ncbi:MAG: hypothetical protein JWM80_2459 [Cyanobacteria bacterium RYN_339]|nr:hypothetical protein [Cyanobacteria bacterium RYN_339]
MDKRITQPQAPQPAPKLPEPPKPEPPKVEAPKEAPKPEPKPADLLALETEAKPDEPPAWQKAIADLPEAGAGAFLAATGPTLSSVVEQGANWLKEKAGQLWEDHKPEFFKPFEIERAAVPPAAPIDPKDVEAHLAQLTPEQRQQYDAVMARLKEPEDPTQPCTELSGKLQQRQEQAQVALQRMLVEGKLPGPTDPVAGKTLLENLQTLSSQPTAPGIDNKRVLTDVVLETQNPARIAQGSFNCCGAGSAEQVLASQNPSEYARIASGLASPEGKVTTQGGLVLERHPQWDCAVNDANNDRSLTGSLMMPAMMQAMNHLGNLGTYENKQAGDNPFAGDGTKVPLIDGLVVPGVLPQNQAALLRNLTGQPYEGELGQGDAWKQAGPGHYVTLAVNYNTGGENSPQPHYLVATGYDPVTHKVSILNPHGKVQVVDEAMLRDHMIGATYP